MTKLTLLLNTLVWLYFSISGIVGYRSIANQDILGYPNSSQAVLYIIFPAISFTLSLTFLIFYSNIKRKLLIYIVGLTSIIMIALMFPYIVLSRGGV